MGLLSDGGVHSHIEHLFGLLELAKKSGLTKVYVHCFMDGRDVPPSSGKDFILQLQNKLDELGIGKIASVMGRYYAMDRDNRWERVEKAYDALVLGKGILCEDAAKAVENSYAQEVTDEFIVPVVVGDLHREGLRRRIRSFSSTSVPTAHVKSPAHWWTRNFPALPAACSRCTMSA